MMDEAFHELELTRLIGPEVLTLDLADLIKKIRETKDAMVKEEFNDVVNKHGRPEGTSENDLVEALKIYKALKGIAEDYSFQAMAVKCWPELMNSGIMSPCLALSKLNDDGIMTACEGDVTAAATMLILYYLTGKQVFLCDLFEMNEADNSYFMYHCGAAPSKLAEKSSDVQLNIHFRKYKPLTPMVLKPGVIADFAIKPGKVTFARLTEKKGKYRLLIMEGEAVPQENLIGGNGMRVKMNGKVKTILERMVREGIEHHQLVVHAEIKKELVELCGFLGIEPLLIEG
jgi:L-fucose isomerase-like protein